MKQVIGPYLLLGRFVGRDGSGGHRRREVFGETRHRQRQVPKVRAELARQSYGRGDCEPLGSSLRSFRSAGQYGNQVQT